MLKYMTEIFNDWKSISNGVCVPCPRCGKGHIVTGDKQNGISRYVDVDICRACEQDEAMLDLSKKAKRLSRWDVVRCALRGKTFLDFLRNRARVEDILECELIIDNSEMPATFVWDRESRITSYGANYFAPIMEAPYEILDNGNIEIFCDRYGLGEEFVLDVAGYIGVSEYAKMFEVPPMDKVCMDNPCISISESGITCNINLKGVDVNERFSLNVNRWNSPVRFTATIHPVTGETRCRYSAGTIDADYPAIEEEIELIRAAMENACVREHDYSLSDLWKNRPVSCKSENESRNGGNLCQAVQQF